MDSYIIENCELFDILDLKIMLVGKVEFASNIIQTVLIIII
jgi:hypothetical protein